MEVPVSKFVHCTLIVILITSVCVKANYNLSISVYSYSNPSHKCATCTTSSSSPSERGCCDNHDNLGTCSEDELCDPGLFFCLLPLNGRSSQDCVDHTKKVAPLFKHNATTITASRGQFLGLDVPFTLEGISDEWRGVKLHIWVPDADLILPNGTNSLSDDDTIDEFYINITSHVGDSTVRKFYNGINNFVTLELAFRVTCAQYYYGDICENLNECELNSVTCNGHGRCEDGVNSYTCECDPGYTGSLCEHEQDHSVTDMPMVCSQSFQLLLGPVNDCEEWRFNNPISKANSIISALIGEISCPGCTIINPEFSCKEAYTQSTLFRATISGNTSLSCNRSVQLLTNWVQSGSVSILVETNRLEVEPSCEVSISSKSDPLICGANVDTTNSQGATDVKGKKDDSNSVIYTVCGVVIALAVIVVVVVVIVILILCVRNSERRRNVTTSSARIQENRTKSLDRSTQPVPTIRNNISYNSSVKKQTKGAEYLGPATRSPSPPHEYEYMYSKPRDGMVSNTEFESQNLIGKSTYSKKKINVSPLDLELARNSLTPQFKAGQTSKFNDDYEDVLY